MAQGPYVAGAASALHNGRTWKRLVRVEKACRLTISGQFSDGDIARHIGITPAHLSLLKQTSEFKTRMIEMRSGVMSQHNTDVVEDIEFQRVQLKAMVPAALMRLQELMLSANPGVSFKATTEILDRQGDHAKVSRSLVDVHHNVDHTAADNTANEIFAILRGTSAEGTQGTSARTPVSASSASGPGAVSGAGGAAPLSDIIAEFTRGAMDSEMQNKIMAENVTSRTLDEIDAAKLGRPQ